METIIFATLPICVSSLEYHPEHFRDLYLFSSDFLALSIHDFYTRLTRLMGIKGLVELLEYKLGLGLSIFCGRIRRVICRIIRPSI